MIEMAGKLFADEFISAQYLHMRPRFVYMLVGGLLMAAGLWAIWYSFFAENPDVPNWSGFMMLAAFAYLLAFFIIYVPWMARRTYRQRKSAQRKIRMKISGTGIMVENEMGQATVPWTDYLKWKENDRIFLLYFSASMYHLVPKRFFDCAENVNDFRQLLLTRIGPDGA